MKAFLILLRRELDLAWGGGGGPLLGCAFLACVTTLLPLSTGASLARLGAVAPGAAWVGLALASLLSLERMFERDFEDGALDLLSLGSAPPEFVALAKGLAQWAANGLPLAVAAPVAALALGAPANLSLLIFACAAVGGLGFAFVGGAGAAVALGARRGGVLIAVIVLPLFCPPVIFGAGAIGAFAAGLPWLPGFGFLCAYSLAALALAPFAMAAAVRNALD
jgi:heme exporter protein B